MNTFTENVNIFTENVNITLQYPSIHRHLPIRGQVEGAAAPAGGHPNFSHPSHTNQLWLATKLVIFFGNEGDFSEILH